MDQAVVEQAVHRHLACGPVEVRPAVPAVAVLQGHHRGLRARRDEVATVRARGRPQRDRRRSHPGTSARPDPSTTRTWRRRATAAESLARRRPALIAPALVVVAVLRRAARRCRSVVAFRGKDGGFTLEHFAKAFDFYSTDLLFTLAIVVLSTVLIGIVAIAIAGYLTLGEHPRAVADAALAVPLAAVHPVRRRRAGDAHVPRQERHAQPRADRQRPHRPAVGAEPARLARHRRSPSSGSRRRSSRCCWPARWRRSNRSTSRRRATSARGGCACCIDIVLPQVRGTLLVGLVLSFVTMLSVLSVPLMINPNSPTMITVDVAYRISTHGDYAVANALCLHLARCWRRSAQRSICGTRRVRRKAATVVTRGSTLPVPRRCGIPRGRCSRCSRSRSSGRSNLLLWAFAENAGTSRTSCRWNSG